MCCIVFILLPGGGCLGCSHLVAAMNIREQVQVMMLWQGFPGTVLVSQDSSGRTWRKLCPQQVCLHGSLVCVHASLQCPGRLLCLLAVSAAVVVREDAGESDYLHPSCLTASFPPWVPGWPLACLSMVGPRRFTWAHFLGFACEFWSC